MGRESKLFVQEPPNNRKRSPHKTVRKHHHSISFGSWWCGAGKDPRTSPYEGEEPTMRKGSYSEELVKNVRTDCGWTDG